MSFFESLMLYFCFGYIMGDISTVLLPKLYRHFYGTNKRTP